MNNFSSVAASEKKLMANARVAGKRRPADLKTQKPAPAKTETVIQSRAILLGGDMALALKCS